MQVPCPITEVVSSEYLLSQVIIAIQSLRSPDAEAPDTPSISSRQESARLATVKIQICREL